MSASDRCCLNLNIDGLLPVALMMGWSDVEFIAFYLTGYITRVLAARDIDNDIMIHAGCCLNLKDL